MTGVPCARIAVFVWRLGQVTPRSLRSRSLVISPDVTSSFLMTFRWRFTILLRPSFRYFPP